MGGSSFRTFFPWKSVEHYQGHFFALVYTNNHFIFVLYLLHVLLYLLICINWKKTCIIWMKYTWSWCMIFIRNSLICCTWIILRIFATRFISKILLCSTFILSLFNLSIRVIVWKSVQFFHSLYIFSKNLRSFTVSAFTWVFVKLVSTWILISFGDKVIYYFFSFMLLCTFSWIFIFI